MTYLNGQERKVVILNTAIQVIYAKGIRAITAREVAQQAGMATGLLHHYFESISDLRAQATLQIFENALQADKKKNVNQCAYKALLSMILGSNTCAPGHCYSNNQLWDEAVFMATGDVNMKATCTQGLKKWHQEVKSIIEKGRKGSDFKPGIGASDLAWQFIGLCCGLEGIAGFHTLPIDTKKIRCQIELMIHAVLLP